MGNNIDKKDTGWLSWFGEYTRKIAREAEQKLADDLKAEEEAAEDVPPTDRQQKALKAMGDALRDPEFEQKQQAAIDRMLKQKEEVGKTTAPLDWISKSPFFDMEHKAQLARILNGEVKTDNKRETKLMGLKIVTEGLSREFYTPRSPNKKS